MIKTTKWAGVLLALSLLLTLFAPKATAVKKGESFHGVYSGQDRTEIYLINGGVMMDGVDKTLAAVKKDGPANVTSPAKTVAAAGVDSLSIQSDLSAILVLPSEGKDIVIEKVSLQDSSAFTLKTEVKKGTLSVDWRGKDDQSYYMNVDQENMVNALRIRLPEGKKFDISIDQGSGIVRVVEPTGSILGKTANGFILVDGEALQNDCKLVATNGKLDVQVNLVAAPLSMEVVNGSALLEAKEATGALDLSAVNGKVSASLGKIKDGSFTATNGRVDLEVGRISGDVEAKVRNGKVNVVLTQKATDLTFHCDYKYANLPEGWHDGVRFGSGKATLRIAAASNGHLDFTAK